jgi:signal transduction histidine kinase
LLQADANRISFFTAFHPMKTLTLRIYLTVVAVLLLFALVSGWVFQRHIELERTRNEGVLSERMAAWGDLIQRSLPGSESPADEQAAALRDWSQRLRIPLALDDAKGERIASSDSYVRRQGGKAQRGFPVRLEDGRTLWVLRPGMGRAPVEAGASSSANPGLKSAADGYAEMHRTERRRIGSPGAFPFPGNLPFVPPEWQGGVGLAAALLLLFVAVAAGAWPVVRQLTRRLQALQSGVEKFGAGALDHRVEVTGRDEVAAVASSFNHAAARIETLVRSHQSLLANASHELRSPLARMKMAVEMMDGAAPEQQAKLKREVDTNIAELDALVEEVLLASRLDAVKNTDVFEEVDLLGMAAEEAARVGAVVDIEVNARFTVQGDERLLRRALRNLLENAKRYGGADITVNLLHQKNATQIQVCDRGPGVSAAQRERIFEPFYRLPGHAEQAGGVGLGLSLVKQIAQRHHGSVSCEAREGGGSCFVLSLPRA